MGFFGKVTRFFRRVLATINVVVIIAMCACGYAGIISPEEHPWTEILVLAFPIPFTLNILFLGVWLLVSPKHLLLPIAGFLLCWTPCRRYCPLNFPSEADKECIKVMSFNVAAFYPSEFSSVVEYLNEHPADITCLQESRLHKYYVGKFDSLLRANYPYISRVGHKGGETLTFLSKHPIIDSEQIEYETGFNTSGACRVLVDGDTLLVINTHLESTSLKQWDRKKIDKILKDRQIDAKERGVLEKLCHAAARRAPQADSVACYIERHQGMTTILCGDFNDTPNSYAYHCVAQHLDNAFEHAGRGISHTYNQQHMNVRIDNIFYSPDMKAVKCEIDQKTNISDHFPVVCWVKKRAKP